MGRVAEVTTERETTGEPALSIEALLDKTVGELELKIGKLIAANDSLANRVTVLQFENSELQREIRKLRAQLSNA